MININWIGKLSSVNKWHGYNTKYKRFFKNPEYKIFQDEIILLLTQFKNKNKIQTIEGDITVIIDVHCAKKRDIDSSIKPILDSIQSSGIIKNDTQVNRLSVNKFIKKKNQQDSLCMYIYETWSKK
jgi:Holliday junction resolvase RusA-like endonuclease